MRQVLLNLLENALEIHRRRRPHHPHDVHRTSQRVEVSVCDNGPGIPEEGANRGFSWTGSASPQTSNRTTGYGVGLAVCRRIVEVHGGRIWVISQARRRSLLHLHRAHLARPRPGMGPGRLDGGTG